MKNFVLLLFLLGLASTETGLRRFNHDISVPLRTEQQFIIDQTGKRVKLSCVNWPSHMENLVPEGLGHVSTDRLVGS
jgi:hypothetical protein